MRYKEDDVRRHLKDLGFKVLEYKSNTHIIIPINIATALTIFLIFIFLTILLKTYV